jgi:neutral amino acid transport system permease protein
MTVRTALDTRALVRAGVILVVTALAFTLYSAWSAAQPDAADRTFTVAEASTGFVPMTDDGAPADDAVDDPALIDDGDEIGVPVASSRATNQLAQSIVNGLAFGLLLALASVGLSLIYGTTGLSNFAHGEQVSLGALLTYFFATQEMVSLPLLPWEFNFGFPLVVSAILAVILAAGFGWLQDRLLWKPLRKRRVGITQQMIVSIGLALALVNLLQWWIGGRKVRLSIAIDKRHQVGPFQIGNQTLISIAIAIACILAVSAFLLYTRLGRATRAVSDNPSLAAASGIKVDGIVRLVWVLAAALAAVGGILLALYEQGSSFDAGSRMLLLMFAAVTLGGLGQPFGALVGSIVIGLVSEVSTVWLPPDLKYASALGILIVVLLFRPQGILGRAERVG